MQKKKWTVLACSVVASAMFYGAPSEAAAEITITNPYATVNWATVGQYKANFHAHSVESDGGNQPAEMFEDHYAKGFDIMALTDHNFTNTTWDRTDRPADKIYLTSERLAEINAGVGRDGWGMIGIPMSNEQSVSDHLNTFWANFNNVSGATLESKIDQAEILGGISHINHPGRYTGGVSTANDGADGELASSDPSTVAYYTDLFDTYPSCVGMEIINKKDGDSFSDRILWDNILKQSMPARPVWGFSNDDAHSTGAVGYSYNMMLLPQNTLDNVRFSMENGTFYAVAMVAKRELGANFDSDGLTPAITNVVVDEAEDTITITGENYNDIEWVANGRIIATGTTIDLNNYEAEISSYVRAQLKGNGGISFTQPFGVNGLEKAIELASVSMTASVTTIAAEAPVKIAFELTGKDTTSADVNLTGATIEYYSNQPAYLETAVDGTVTLIDIPPATLTAKVYAKVTVGASTVFSNTVDVTVTVKQVGGNGDYLTAAISNTLDDVEEGQDGSMYFDSSDLEITEEGTNNQFIGLRFTQLAIPKGATITGAYIQFSVDETINSDSFNVNIVAEAVANSAGFENLPFSVSSRVTTATPINWSGIPKWTTVHETGVSQQTPDLAALLQKIVDMDGWAEGNAISFILSGTGTRIAESYEGAGSNQDQIPTLYYSYTVNPEGTELVVPISNALDDMEERADGSLDWDSSDLEITQESTNQLIGLRFSGLAIPRGATITNAYIQFSVDEPGKSADPFDINIFAEAVANSAGFENTPGTVSSRATTATSVNWSGIPMWTVEHEAGVNQQTADLAALAQEIVDMDGWAEGNAISFILSGTGTRSAESYEGSGSNQDQIPTLHLWYTFEDQVEPVDVTPPVITANIADGDALERIGEFDLSCEATDDITGVEFFNVFLDGEAIDPLVVLNIEAFTFGEHTLAMKAQDYAGNESTMEITFSVTGNIETLLALLEDAYQAGYITNKGIYNSLSTKLEKGNMGAFINELNAKTNKKHIDSWTATLLAEYADHIVSQE